MGRQTRPVYICDKCGVETLESRDVRKIIGNVSDGEGKHNYVGDNFIKSKKGAIQSDIEVDRTIGDTSIGSNMYCLDCFPKVLRINETQEERQAVDLLKERIDNTSTNNLISKAKKEITEEKKRKSVTPERITEHDVEETFQETSTKLDDILDDYESEDDTIDDELEEEEPVETIQGGVYHVLTKIKDEEGEELIAKFYEFESVKDMRDSYGGPLIGVYATTGKYVDEIPECEFMSIKLFVNAVMGIPNVVDIDCQANDTYAFVERSYIVELMGENKVE